MQMYQWQKVPDYLNDESFRFLLTETHSQKLGNVPLLVLVDFTLEHYDHDIWERSDIERKKK